MDDSSCLGIKADTSDTVTSSSKVKGQHRMSGDDGEPRPRLCHLIKRDNFNGFGFNLHAEKSRPGQFVGVIDDGSPAEAAGLKEGDRIVEVNGVNISMENHKQVVSRIKAVPDETKLLVVDREADDYYRRKDCVVRGSMPNVLYLTSNREVGGPSAAVGGGPSGNGHHHHHVVVGEEDLREVQEGRGQINRDRLSSGGNSVSSGKVRTGCCFNIEIIKSIFNKLIFIYLNKCFIFSWFMVNDFSGEFQKNYIFFSYIYLEIAVRKKLA